MFKDERGVTFYSLGKWEPVVRVRFLAQSADEGHPYTQRKRTRPNDGSEPELGFRRLAHPMQWAQDEFGFDPKRDLLKGYIVMKSILRPNMDEYDLLSWRLYAKSKRGMPKDWRDAQGELAEQVREAWWQSDDADEGSVIKGEILGCRGELVRGKKTFIIYVKLREPVLRYLSCILSPSQLIKP